MSDKRVERRLAAILVADIAGYSRLMGADEVAGIVQMFLDQMNDDINTLVQSAMASDVGPLAARAHSLAGIAGNVGALRLGEIARRIEAETRAGKAASALLMLTEEAQRAAEAAASACSAWLAGQTPALVH